MPGLLNCNIGDLNKINYECGNCKTCNPTSNLVYPFERNLTTSETLVEELKYSIEKNTNYRCEPTTILKNPDICVINKNNDKIICRTEAKYLEGKAFMKAEKILGLKPKETLVVDGPKLISYFECDENDFKELGYHVPIFIVWKFDRPCQDIGGICVYQNIDVLHTIYRQKGYERTFTRQRGEGDIVSRFELGIRDKYHFSIKECKPIENLISEILSIP